MGKPSDKKRSARRLGKSERARVKNRHRRRKCTMLAIVPSAGTYRITAGRKKFANLSLLMLRLISKNSPSIGESTTLKTEPLTGRLGYKVGGCCIIELSPPAQASTPRRRSGRRQQTVREVG